MEATYPHLNIKKNSHVLFVEISRPEKANALDEVTWLEIGKLFASADQDSSVRAIVISGEGKNFCGGIDISLIETLARNASQLSEGRKQEFVKSKIQLYQESFNAIENCRKPVIAAIHGACFGAGIDLASACDIRYTVSDAKLCIKELDLAIVADVGTIQRLPKIIGEGRARELTYTAAVISGKQAVEYNFSSACMESKDELLARATAVAELIASKSPLAVRGTKQMFNYSRDHNVRDGLDMVATWNSSMLLSEDLQRALVSVQSRQNVVFED